MRLVFALVVAVALAAGCDSSTSPGPEPAADAGAADAQPAEGPGTGNALGRTCAGPQDCPSDPLHTCVFLQSGNPALGYCSPSCEIDPDCAEGYEGPEGGAPTCFVPNNEGACSILCGTNEDCPSALECKITGGPVNVCATI